MRLLKVGMGVSEKYLRIGYLEFFSVKLEDKENHNESLDSNGEEYEGFEYDMIKAIANETAIRACNASVESSNFGGCWIILTNSNNK